MNFSDQEEPLCRICYSDADPISGCRELISPCNCNGSVKFVHSVCLKMWRFKGSFLSEIKICETCKAPYTIVGERSPHHYIISFSSIAFMSGAYIVSTLFFDSIFTAIVALIRDVWIDNLYIDYPNPKYRQSDFTYHISCAMVLITFYKLYNEYKVLQLVNYVFTFWRIIQFDFLVDKILFIGFSTYFLFEIYRSIYRKMDRFYFYMMNANIDSKDA